METHKYVYRFGSGQTEGNRKMKKMLGGKGANLAEMSEIGLPVPPGFTITTEACAYYTDHEYKWPPHLREQIAQGVNFIEKTTGSEFGSGDNPLLLSVRSGAAISMPGMMDTVLNLGMNDRVAERLARKTGNRRFSADTYRRFIEMFGNVIMGVDYEHFEDALTDLKKENGMVSDADLEISHLEELVKRYKQVYRQHTGSGFPEDPNEQLEKSVNAVFRSWNSQRAVKYREINRIRNIQGTAVNVQVMVFGNMGDHSGTGVCFTRNPSDGEKVLYGEFLLNAQGEDVVAGRRTPLPVSDMQDKFPGNYKRLQHIARLLEAHYRDVQDIEFTVQEDKLYILQTRSAQRTGKAAMRIAVNLVEEGLVSREEAVRDLVEPIHIDQLLHKQFADPRIDPDDILGTGLPASPGAAVGKAIFDSDLAEKARQRGERVILVRVNTSPEDVGGMSSAEGILTSQGGMTSHAAVVARGWGKPCVAGCGDIHINYKLQSFTNGTVTIKAGDWISIDGATGQVVRGRRELTDPEFDDNYHTFMKWVDEFRTLQVRANADTPEDALKSIEFGAEGIGLTRTEHMFFVDGRITAVRRMIIAENAEERREALDRIMPFQKDDFVEIFKAMNGRPVTIRLLDPPLHEFLPEDEEEIIHVAEDLGISARILMHKIRNLKEINPMLGHRGCRLGIVYPEITRMQTRAVIEAAVEVCKSGMGVKPEIMVPLIGTVNEFIHQKKLICETAEEIFKREGMRVDYLTGTMIEVPRAAITAGVIAEHAEFFSFGTNDLTQTVFAYSRDDAAKFLGFYITEGILKEDPFVVIDRDGVGFLIRHATESGRQTRPDLKVGVCGEHGGDHESIEFFYENNLEYISCSPYRLPLARLALAQVHLRHSVAVTQ